MDQGSLQWQISFLPIINGYKFLLLKLWGFFCRVGNMGKQAESLNLAREVLLRLQSSKGIFPVSYGIFKSPPSCKT